MASLTICHLGLLSWKAILLNPVKVGCGGRVVERLAFGRRDRGSKPQREMEKTVMDSQSW